MRYYNADHPEWRYKIGRKEWLKKKRQRKKCKELFIAGNLYAQRMAERCKTIDELKKLVLKDLHNKNLPQLRNYKKPLEETVVEEVAKDLRRISGPGNRKKLAKAHKKTLTGAQCGCQR